MKQCYYTALLMVWAIIALLVCGELYVNYFSYVIVSSCEYTMCVFVV